MDKKNFAFDKGNFIALIVGIAIVLIGESTTEKYDPSIFDARHTKVAPIVTLIGFVSIIYAIIRKPKTNNEEQTEE